MRLLLWSCSESKETKSWKSSAAFFSQQQCTVISGSGLSEQGVGKGSCTPLPNLNRARSERHQLLAPQQATRENGKKKVMTKAAAINTEFPNKGTSPRWAPPEITLPHSSPPPLPQNKINLHHKNMVLWLSVR